MPREARMGNIFDDLRVMVEKTTGDIGEGELGIRRTLADSRFDLSLGLCYRLARERRRDATNLARELASAIEAERGFEARAERGIVHIRVPDEWLMNRAPWSVLPHSIVQNHGFEAPVLEHTAAQHLRILLRTPREGTPEVLCDKGRARFAAHAVMQGLLWCATQRWSGAETPRAAVITDSASPSWSPFEDMRSAVTVLRGLVGTKTPESMHSEGDNFDVQSLECDFVWVAEDFRQRRDVSSMTAGAAPNRPNEGAPRIVGCDRLRVFDIPEDHNDVPAEFPLDRWRSYLLYAVFPDPGREFIPSACGLESYEDVYQRINRLRARIERFLSPQWFVDGEAAQQLLRAGFSKEHQLRLVLVDALMYRMMAYDGATHGAVQEWGALTARLLSSSEMALGTRPDKITGEPREVALYSYVFSCIYQALTDMLTIVR